MVAVAFAEDSCYRHCLAPGSLKWKALNFLAKRLRTAALPSGCPLPHGHAWRLRLA